MQILAEPQSESAQKPAPFAAASFSSSPNQDPQSRQRALLHALMVKRRGLEQSPLENSLSAERLTWLAQYAATRRDSYYAALSGWRTKLERFEQQAEDNFAWRRKEGNRNAGRKSIFDVQNDSLNVIGAFCEFFTAQAKNDLFGSTPWFTARPEGQADHSFAEQLSKHAAWKLRHADVSAVYGEAVKLTAMLGTCFTKKTWLVRTDTYEEPITVLQDALTHKPIQTSQGDVIHAGDGIEEEEDEQGQFRRYPKKDPHTDLSKGSYEYNKAFRKSERVTYRNLKAVNLHYKDVAFDPMAPELDLCHTDFFHTFTKNLHDIVRDYGLSREDAHRIHANLSERSEAQRAVSFRGEAEPSRADVHDYLGALPNIPVRLDEGFMRLDVTGKKEVCNIYIVFCREIDLVLKVDYLANITPEGLLPIHAHTIERIPFRIVGRGFFEHLETAQTIIDDHFNRINWHDRKRSQPIQAFDKSKLMQEDEEENAPFDDEKPVNLKPDAKLEDYLQFKDYPDLSSRSVEMLHLTVQMVQLRKGITAASQGDMTGVPENNTATGIKQLMSRAAVLLKAPVDDLKRSFTKDLYYAVKLLYSNFDRDEAFLYGEGENMTLIQLRADQVRDLEIDIELLLTQSQNAFRLENAKSGIALFTQYAQLPEMEKQHGRHLWIQALRALDFADADQIIRPAAVDLKSALTILPEELQKQITTALNSAGGDSAKQPGIPGASAESESPSAEGEPGHLSRMPELSEDRSDPAAQRGATTSQSTE